MSKPILIRCFVVSFVIAILAGTLSSTVLVAPEEGETVPDFSTTNSAELATTGFDEVETMYLNTPMRELTGFERFTYPMTHPQYFSSLYKVYLTWFLGLFIATITVSYLNAKRT